MSSVSGFRGIYAVDWAQTAPGDEWGLAPDLLTVGMSWRWRGQALRLDAGVATLWLDAPYDRGDPRARARSRLRRLALAPIADAPDVQAADDAVPSDWLTMTDGRRQYTARIVRQGRRLLMVFDPLLPPPDHELWLTAINLDVRREGRATGVICFLPGTAIETPNGPRAVETLEPGALVSTRDHGAQPVVWRGETRLSGAELYLHPQLRPLRVRAGALGSARPTADLFVSPGHRLLMHRRGGPCESDVLVAAADLEDGRNVRRDFSLTSVRYVHLMLARHEILTANGVACESFHPGLADRQVLDWHARGLERAMPGIVANPGRYGDAARRCLSAGEARILRRDLV